MLLLFMLVHAVDLLFITICAVTDSLRLPDYAHRRCSVEGKVSPAQLYKQLLDKTAVFTIGADCTNAMVCNKDFLHIKCLYLIFSLD